MESFRCTVCLSHKNSKRLIRLPSDIAVLNKQETRAIIVQLKQWYTDAETSDYRDYDNIGRLWTFLCLLRQHAKDLKINFPPNFLD